MRSFRRQYQTTGLLHASTSTRVYTEEDAAVTMPEGVQGCCSALAV